MMNFYCLVIISLLLQLQLSEQACLDEFTNMAEPYLNQLNITYKQIELIASRPGIADNCFYVIELEATSDFHRSLCEHIGGRMGWFNKKYAAIKFSHKMGNEEMGNEAKHVSFSTGLTLQKHGENKDPSWMWVGRKKGYNLRVEINNVTNQLLFDLTQHGAIDLSESAKRIIKQDDVIEYDALLTYYNKWKDEIEDIPRLYVNLIAAGTKLGKSLCEVTNPLRFETAPLLTTPETTSTFPGTELSAQNSNSIEVTFFVPPNQGDDPFGNNVERLGEGEKVKPTDEVNGNGNGESLYFIGPIFLFLLCCLLLLIVLVLVKITRLKKELESITSEPRQSNYNPAVPDTGNAQVDANLKAIAPAEPQDESTQQTSLYYTAAGSTSGGHSTLTAPDSQASSATQSLNPSSKVTSATYPL